MSGMGNTMKSLPGTFMGLGWRRSETARSIADPLNLFHKQEAPAAPPTAPPAPTLQTTDVQGDQAQMELMRRMSASQAKVNPTGAAGLAFGYPASGGAKTFGG